MSFNRVKNLIEIIRKCELRCKDNTLQNNLYECISELNNKINLLNEIKKIYQEKNDEKVSNCLLIMEFVTKADISFFEFSKAFSKGDFGKSWDQLQTSLIYYGFAVDIANQIGFRSKEIYISLKNVKKIIELFPQQYFMSLEILIKKMECSICGKDMRICNHIKGKAYNGEYCKAIVKDMELYKGVAVTKNPLDPRCRIVPAGTDYDKGWFIENFSEKKKMEIIKIQKEIKENILNIFGTFTKCI